MQEPCCKHQRRFYLQILKQFHSFETLSDDDIDLQATGRIYQKFRRRECCFGSNIPPAHVRESVATYLLLSGKLLTFEQHVNIVADRVLAPDRLCNLFAFLPFFTSSWPPAHLTAKSSTSDTQLTLSWRTCPKKSFVQNQNMGRHRKNKLSQLQKILMEIWVCEYMIFYLKQNTLSEIRFRK